MALFNLFGKNKKATEEKATPVAEQPDAPLQDIAETPAMPVVQPKLATTAPQTAPWPIPETKVKQSFFARIKNGLSRTRSNFGDGLSNLFLGAKQIDDDLFEELETQLLVADVGIEATCLLYTSPSPRD